MDAARLKRIQDKLIHAEDRLGLFLEWLDEAMQSTKDLLACYKAIQEAAEALADVAAMIVKDLGVSPHDDYGNHEAMEQHGVVGPQALKALIELNGLRNALVHDYDRVSDERALDAAERLAPDVLLVIEEVRAWLLTKH